MLRVEDSEDSRDCPPCSPQTCPSCPSVLPDYAVMSLGALLILALGIFIGRYLFPRSPSSQSSGDDGFFSGMLFEQGLSGDLFSPVRTDSVADFAQDVMT
jgi:hypothetical protein